jgi:hypothetical protein
MWFLPVQLYQKQLMWRSRGDPDQLLMVCRQAQVTGMPEWRKYTIANWKFMRIASVAWGKKGSRSEKLQNHSWERSPSPWSLSMRAEKAMVDVRGGYSDSQLKPSKYSQIVDRQSPYVWCDRDNWTHSALFAIERCWIFSKEAEIFNLVIQTRSQSSCF